MLEHSRREGGREGGREEGRGGGGRTSVEAEGGGYIVGREGRGREDTGQRVGEIGGGSHEDGLEEGREGGREGGRGVGVGSVWEGGMGCTEKWMSE